MNTLNFADGITVSCWIRPDNLSISHESFILSHGSWQNRWKLSLNAGKVRWTLNTSASIKDVDSSDGLIEGENYHIVATYDGTYAILYINGKLDNSVKLEEGINSTSYDFLIGRMLTDDTNEFNYEGVIDEILIYDFALTPEEAISLIDAPIINGINKIEGDNTIDIYPNPTEGKVYFNLTSSFQEVRSVDVYNAFGKKITSVFLKNKNSDDHIIDFLTYPNGVYYIELGLNNSIITKRIVVLK